LSKVTTADIWPVERTGGTVLWKNGWATLGIWSWMRVPQG
jgi:hypothetical protein